MKGERDIEEVWVVEYGPLPRVGDQGRDMKGVQKNVGWDKKKTARGALRVAYTSVKKRVNV